MLSDALLLLSVIWEGIGTNLIFPLSLQTIHKQEAKGFMSQCWRITV